MRKAYNKGALYGDSDNTYYFDNLIQSLSKPKEYEFVPEMEIVKDNNNHGTGDIFHNNMKKEFKIINNKIQGTWEITQKN